MSAGGEAREKRKRERKGPVERNARLDGADLASRGLQGLLQWLPAKTIV